MWGYSHGGPIRRWKRGDILTAKLRPNGENAPLLKKTSVFRNRDHTDDNDSLVRPSSSFADATLGHSRPPSVTLGHPRSLSATLGHSRASSRHLLPYNRSTLL
eukprot:4596650-Pyramimonas_sp.AAC.1